ncbi:MAG: GUN4 domain-containing protein [Brasilonema angustatum HA4187-MV1]|nr:GUN4 domain-containing protein [Brasilonema angustatum HA4187-MV1]
MENFPCTDLRTIDQLWVKYSGGRFGFSVQKRIWERVGEDYEKFGDRVGWRKGMFWNREWLNYNELTFSINAPQGHLPRDISERVLGPEWRTRSWAVNNLFSRVQTCKL